MSRKITRRITQYPPVAVVIPAHNESDGILPTITDIQAQLRPQDRLIVVADNCTDDTASIASAAGAEVVERKDTTKIGKGYALDFGLAHLSNDPPGIVVMIDADCRVSPHAIAELASTCQYTNRPIQGLDLMQAPNRSQLSYQAAEFAWRVKNCVRPIGLLNLNLPCQLMGTGMAFPWQVIRATDLASGRIVEDLRLGLDLALAGSPALFSTSAVVTSYFPESTQGAAHQRRRWEHGHIQFILSAVPRFLALGVVRRNLGLFILALDAAIPPLTLFGLLLTGTFVLSGFAAFLGLTPLIISGIALAAFLLSAFLSWRQFGQDLLPHRRLHLIARYGIGKLSVYGALVFRRGVSQWHRADRSKTSSDDR